VAVRCLGGIALAAASIWVVKFYLARSRAGLLRRLRRADWQAWPKKAEELAEELS
jgi:hypothetical protein